MNRRDSIKAGAAVVACALPAQVDDWNEWVPTESEIKSIQYFDRYIGRVVWKSSANHPAGVTGVQCVAISRKESMKGLIGGIEARNWMAKRGRFNWTPKQQGMTA